jgi:hypothetical protein
VACAKAALPVSEHTHTVSFLLTGYKRPLQTHRSPDAPVSSTPAAEISNVIVLRGS